MKVFWDLHDHVLHCSECKAKTTQVLDITIALTHFVLCGYCARKLGVEVVSEMMKGMEAVRTPTKAQIRASRRNGRKPVREGSRPRGRPRGPQPWLELGITRQAWYARKDRKT